MEINTDRPVQCKVYTTEDGRAIIEQSGSSIVLFSADQILAVIEALHACYDYCAAWKPSTQDQGVIAPEIQP